MAFITSSHANRNVVLQVIDAAYDRLMLRRAHSKCYRRTLNELNSLSDRDLADLGLHRADLHRVARESADLATAKM